MENWFTLRGEADKNILASDEDVRSISQKLMAQNKEAYEVLAK